MNRLKIGFVAAGIFSEISRRWRAALSAAAPHRLITPLLAATLCCIAVAAQAQTTIYWNGTDSNNTTNGWNLAASWSTSSSATTPNPGSAPSLAGNDIVDFSISTVTTTAQTVDLNANQSALGLVFLATDTGGVTIQNGTGTDTLTLGASGIVMNSGTGAATISSAIALSGSQSWANSDASANILTVSGGISLASTVNTATTLTLASTSTATNVISGPITTGGTTGAALNLTVSTGLWNIGNASDNFNGATLIEGGSTVTVSNASAFVGNSSVTVGDASADVTSTLVIGNALTLASNITLQTNTAGGRGQLENTTNDAATYTGNITLVGQGAGSIAELSDLGTGVFTVGTLGTSTITGDGNAATFFLRGGGSGILNSKVSIGGTELAVTDNSTWTINSTSNTWGTTQISYGTIKLGATNALPTATALLLGQNASTQGSTLNLNGFSQTVGSATVATFSTGDTATITNSSGTLSNFTINDASADTFGNSNFGNITGNVAVVNAGAGAFTLGGAANSFTGGLTITNGSVIAGNSNSGVLGSGTVSMNLNNSTLLNLAGVSPTVSLLVSTGSGSGGVIANNTASTVSTLTLNGTSTQTFGGSIENNTGTGGTVALTMIGTGTQILSGANTYTGATTVNAGTLSLTGSLKSSTLNMGGGTFSYSNPSGSTTQSFATTNINFGASVINATVAGDTLALGLLSRGIGGVVNFATATGSITTTTDTTGGILGGYTTFGGTTWAVSQASGSPVPITGLSSYETTTAGGATAANYAGTNVDVTSSPGSLDTAATVNSMRFNTAGAETFTFASGANTITTGGILVTTNVGANASTITGGTIEGAAGADLVVIQNNTSAGLTIGSAIADNGSPTPLTKWGAGTLTLSGLNTYTGETLLNAGTLQAGVSSTLTGSGATAAVTNGPTGAGGLLAQSAGSVLDVNTFNVAVGGLSGSGTVASSSTSTAGGLTIVTGASPQTYSGVIANATNGGTTAVSLTIDGSGTQTLKGVSTYTGGTTINSGILIAGSTTAFGPASTSAGAITAGASLTYGSASTGDVRLNGNSMSLVGLSSNAILGTPILENASATASTLTINLATTAADTFGGILQDGVGGGALSLAIGGMGTAGSLTTNGGSILLSGNNTFTGSVSMNGANTGVTATLILANSGALGAGTKTVTSEGGGQIQLQGGITLGSNISWTTSGDAEVNNVGTANLPLINNNSGNNTINGAFTLQSGDGATAFGSTSGLLTINGGITAGSTGRALNLQGTGYGLITGAITIGSGAYGINMNSTGTWTLASPSNTDTGAVAANSGTLNVTTAGAIDASSAATIASGAAFNYAATSNAQLKVASLAITGGGVTAIGGSIGSTATGAEIAATGTATTTATAVAVNIFGIPGVSPVSGTNTYTLVAGTGASTLNNATYSLGTVYNASNFTVGALSSTTTALNVSITSVTANSAEYWVGGYSNNQWAASNGSTTSNWVTTSTGGATSQTPGSGTTLTFSATSPTPTGQNSMTLGANMSIAGAVFGDAGGDTLSADGNTLTIEAGGVTVNSGSGAVTLSSLVALGAAQSWTNNSSGLLTVGGNVSNGTNLLTVAGSGPTTVNNFTGGTGGLTVSSSSGDPTATLSGTVVLSGAQTWTNNSTNMLTISGNILNGANGLTIAGTGNTTISGLLGNGAGALTINGTGTLTLSGLSPVAAANYSGATIINEGTLAISSNASLTGALNFGASAGSINVGALAINNSTTFAGLTTVQTNTTSDNTVTIASGQTLTLAGGLSMGINNATVATYNSEMTVSGAGSLAITGTSALIGISQSTINAGNNDIGTLTLSGLTGSGQTYAFTANVTNFFVGQGYTSSGILTLTNSGNSIIATELEVGDSGVNNPGTVTPLLTLGTSANIIDATTINIGIGKSGGTLSWTSQMDGSSGTLAINGTSGGTSAANITIGSRNTTTGTSSAPTGLLDLVGHAATVTAGTLLIGNDTAGGANSGTITGTLDFDTGAFTANTLDMGFSNDTSTGGATGNLNIGNGTGGAFTATSVVMASKTGNGGNAATATINLSGGSFTVNSGGSFAMATNTGTAGTAVAAVNITGGTFTSNVAITAGGGTGASSTITLNGGTLNMAGHAIGASADSITLAGESGTLENLGLINGTGGFTKSGTGTLTVTGANTYSGTTTITGGTLIMNGSASATSEIIISGGTNSTLLVTNTTGAGSGEFFIGTGATTPVIQLHINGGGTIALPNSFGGNSGITTTIDVNNNGDSSQNGIIQLNGLGADYANSTLNVTGGNGYSLYIAQIIDSAGTPGTETYNPTTASLTLGSITGASTQPVGTDVIDLDGTYASNAVTGVISNSGVNSITAVTKSNTSTWTLSGANTYTGGTIIQEGTLRLGASNTLPTGGSVTFGNGAANSGTLDLAGFNAQVGGLAVSSTAGTVAANQIIGNSAATPIVSTLTFSGGTSTFGGTIQDVLGTNNGQTVGLTVAAGSLTLSGTNTYSGPTTLNGGILNLTGTLGNTPIVVSGGALTGSGDGVLTDVAAGSVTVNPTGAIDFSKNGLTATTTMALGGLALNGGSLTFNLASTGTDLINLGAGALSGSGCTVNLNPLLGYSTSGTYNLVAYGSESGLTVGVGGDLTLGTVPTASLSTYALNLTNTSGGAGDLQIIITGNPTPYLAYWTGLQGGSFNWGDNSGASTSNWSTSQTASLGTSDAGQLPAGITDVVFANQNASSASLTTNLEKAYTINSLTILGSSVTSPTTGAAVTIGGGVGDSLTILAANNANGMNYTAGTGIVVQSGAAGLTISTAGGVIVPVSQSWTNSSTGPLLVSSGVQGSTANNTPVTLTLSDAGGGTTLAGAVTDGTGAASPLSLTINSSTVGVATLSGLSATAANNYSGTTTLLQGTLAIATSNASLSGPVTFGVTVAATGSTSLLTTTTSALNLTNANLTLNSLLTLQTNSVTPNTIAIANGQTLTLAGGLTMGINNNTQSTYTTNLQVTGQGTLAITGGNVVLGVGQSQNNGSNINQDSATLDVSGLNGTASAYDFTANVTNFYVGAGTTSGGTLLLSNTSNKIVATTLLIGDSDTVNAQAQTGVLTLGTGANVIDATTIGIGLSKEPGTFSWLSQADGGAGTLTINGTSGGTSAANITVGSNTSVIGGVTDTGAVATGTLDLRGQSATVTAGALSLGISNNTSNGGATGTLNFDTGTFTVSGALTLASKSGTGGTGAATGTINLSGGSFTLMSGSTFTMATNTATTGTAVALLDITGGTFTSDVNIAEGGGTGTSGTITLNGGTLNMTGNNIGGATPINILNFESGTLENVPQINSGAGLTKTTAGTLLLAGTNSYTGGTNIQQGTLRLGASSAMPGSGAVTFGNGTGSDGTLDLAGFNASVGGLAVSSAAGTVAANQIIGSGAASSIVSTLTVSGTSSFGGTIQDVLGTNNGQTVALTVASGSLSLTGANAYSGPTSINGGTLALSNNASGNNITSTASIGIGAGASLNVTNLQSGTLLLGSGTASQTLSGPSSGTGTVTGSLDIAGIGPGVGGGTIVGTAGGVLSITGGLTFTAGSTADFSLPTSLNPGSPLINVAGILSPATSGSTAVNLTYSTVTRGTYDLIGAATGPGSSANFSLDTAAPAGYSWQLVAQSNQIDLVVSAALTWTGQTGGNGSANSSWDTVSTNWAAGAPLASINYLDGSPVMFADENPLASALVPNSSSANSSALATVTVASGVSPGSITFTNVGPAHGGVDYSIGGASIGGTTGIMLNGNGTVGGNVFLTGANAFYGPVAVNLGQLVLQNGQALGNSSGVSVAFGAALSLQSGSGSTGDYGLTFTGSTAIPTALAGTGISGNGALASINGINTYGGAITIASGGATIGSLSNSNGDRLTLNGGINNNGNLLTFAGAGNSTVSTSGISGAGGLTYNGTGVLTLSAANNSYSGTTTVNSGTLRLTGSLTSMSGVVNVGGTSATEVATTGSIGGTPSLVGGGTIAGSVEIFGNTGGSVAGHLAPSGFSGSPPTFLNINGSLTLDAGAVLDFYLSGTPDSSGTSGPAAPSGNNDYVVVGGSLASSAGGTLNINDPHGLTVGTYVLATYASGFPSATGWNYTLTTPVVGATLNFSTANFGQFDLVVTAGNGSAAWASNSSTGVFDSAGSWSPTQIPSGAGLTATFDKGTQTNPSITVTIGTNTGSDTVGSLVFNSSTTAYTLSSGTLILNNNGSGPNITVSTSKEPEINTPLVLADGNGTTTRFNISGGSYLDMFGAISEATYTDQKILLTGGGSLELDGANSYTGGTTVANGTLIVGLNGTGTLGTGPLAINGSSSIVNVNPESPALAVGSLSGTGGGQLNIAPSASLTVNQTATSTFNGTLLLNGGLVLAASSGNTLTINGTPSIAAGSSITVNSGTLALTNSGSAASAGAAAVTVVSEATLQLAGSANVLGSAVNITTQGSGTSGDGAVSVVGASTQTVGVISGTQGNGSVTTYAGNTTVGDGTNAANLTATQILQNTLTINAGSTVTIAPSGSGIPADAVAATSAITTSDVATGATTADSDSTTDPFTAIEDAIAAGSISGARGQQLENRIAAIERLAATDPGLDASLLEDRVLAVLPSPSVWSSSSAGTSPLAETAQGLLAVETSSFAASSDATSSSAAFAFSASANFGGGPAAVPEPSTLLLAALGAIGILLAVRRRTIDSE